VIFLIDLLALIQNMRNAHYEWLSAWWFGGAMQSRIIDGWSLSECLNLLGETYSTCVLHFYRMSSAIINLRVKRERRICFATKLRANVRYICKNPRSAANKTVRAWSLTLFPNLDADQNAIATLTRPATTTSTTTPRNSTDTASRQCRTVITFRITHMRADIITPNTMPTKHRSAYVHGEKIHVFNRVSVARFIGRAC